MSTLTGTPYGQTETGAAYAEAAVRTGYKAAHDRYVETAGYALSVLQAIASGEQPKRDETAAEYAQRHIDQMRADGRIKPEVAA